MASADRDTVASVPQSHALFAVLNRTANPVVRTMLSSPLHPLLSRGLALITVIGRRSGRRYTFPVGYRQDGDRVTVTVGAPARKRWWRNLRDEDRVEKCGFGAVAGLAERRHTATSARRSRSRSSSTQTQIPSAHRPVHTDRAVSGSAATNYGNRCPERDSRTTNTGPRPTGLRPFPTPYAQTLTERCPQGAPERHTSGRIAAWWSTRVRHSCSSLAPGLEGGRGARSVDSCERRETMSIRLR